MRNVFLVFFLLFAASLLRGQGSAEPVHSHQYFTQGGSYFFVDTTLDLTTYRSQNELLTDDFGQLTTGNLGGARFQLIARSSQALLPELGFGLYAPYFQDPNAIRYFQVKSAFTEARYVHGYERGQFFSILHTQNVHKRWNFSFQYQRLNSLGKYFRQKATGGDFLSTTHYTSKKGAYEAYAYFRSMRRLIFENGGLRLDSVFTDNTVTDRLLVETNLSTAQQVIRRREGYVHHSLALFAPEKDSLGVWHGLDLGLYNTVHYKRDIRSFAETPNGFLGTPQFYNEAGRDSSRLDALVVSGGIELNRIGALEKVEARVGGFYDQRQFANAYALRRFTHFGIEGEVHSPKRSPWTWMASGKVLLLGEWAGLQQWKAMAGWKSRSWNFSAGMDLLQQQPTWFYQMQISNYAYWNNQLSPERRDRVYGSVRAPWFGSAEISINRWEQFVYLNEQARPAQAQEALVFPRVEWKTHVPIWTWLFLDPQFVYQGGLAAKGPLRQPDWLARAAVYSQFKLFNKAMEVQVGTEINAFAPFYALQYRPDLVHGILQNEQQVGGYPWLDVFVNAKIQEAKAFIKLEHVNASISGFDYWAAPGYPRTDFILRLGLQWRFFN